jgi:hypothetical protein
MEWRESRLWALCVVLPAVAACCWPQGACAQAAVPSLDVDAHWPEQLVETNTIHKLRVPRGGQMDIVAKTDPAGAELGGLRVSLSCEPAVEIVALSVDGQAVEAGESTSVDPTRPGEVRWSVRLPWEPRVSHGPYRFEVTMGTSSRRSRVRGAGGGGLSATLKKSVTVEEGVCCWDTTAKARVRQFATSEYCRLETIGQSALGRDMYLLRVTDWSVPAEGKKQVIVIGPYHGDEPAGTEASLDLVDELISKPENAKYLRGIVFYVLPSHNPDGHESGIHWGTHDVDPGNHAYEKMEIPEAVAVAGALRKYAPEFTAPFGIVHHQWMRDYTLISHMDRVPGDEAASLRAVNNACRQVANELGCPMHPLYSVYDLDTFTGVRGMMSAEMNIPNYTLENMGMRAYDLAQLMPNVVREMALYYATFDQLLQPSFVAARPRPPVAFDLEGDRVCEAHTTAAAPTIDGRLDDACWRDAAEARGFRPFDRRSSRSAGAAVRVAYDDENLYLAFTNPYMRPLATRPADDEAASPDTVVATFAFDTNFNRWSCFHFLLARNGELTCQYVAVPWVPQDGPDASACKTAVSVADGTAELSIPLALFNFPQRVDAALSVPLVTGSVWGASFVMEDPVNDNGETWAEMRWGTVHRTDQFNGIRFAGPAGAGDEHSRE